jgi:hypothetical protein
VSRCQATSPLALEAARRIDLIFHVERTITALTAPRVAP